MTLKEQLDDFVSTLPIINEKRNYWMVRTQGGSYYAPFVQFSYIGLDYDKISYEKISKLKQQHKEEAAYFAQLKEIVVKAYPDERSPGLIAGQIDKFIFGIEKDDIVLIPSESSNEIAIGRVTQTAIVLSTDPDARVKDDANFKFKKKVKWIRQISKYDLDPFLYRALFSHQAISNLKSYAEVIERSISNFFVREGEANLVLDIEKDGDIYAKELFGLGQGYLDFLDSLSKEYNLGVSSNELEVKITLNSPGRLHFKAPKWSTVVLFGLAVVAINGGGLKVKVGNFDLDLSTNGIIKSITDYKNNDHDRKMQDNLYTQYKDSLKVKQPDDLLKLLQQSSTNKNNPK